MHAMSKSRAREKRMVHIKSTQYAISYAHLYNHLFRNKGKKATMIMLFKTFAICIIPVFLIVFPISQWTSILLHVTIR